jgi:hypothetical protein
MTDAFGTPEWRIFLRTYSHQYQHPLYGLLSLIGRSISTVANPIAFAHEGFFLASR